MNPEEIKNLVRQYVAEEVRAQMPSVFDFLKRRAESEKSDVKIALDNNYLLYNATNARSANPPPRGSIMMVDAGTTPNRAIALYLSTGGTLVEIFAKVI